LAPEDINRLAPLLSGPLPERARPMKKTIDSLGRHVGVSMVG
jgi:hypothetical protein